MPNGSPLVALDLSQDGDIHVCFKNAVLYMCKIWHRFRGQVGYVFLVSGRDISAFHAPDS